MAVTGLQAAEIAIVALVGALVQVKGGLRRHEVRIIVVKVAGEVKEHGADRRAV